MRIFVAFLFLSILFACNQSRETKACNAVKDYLKKNLNDPKSYDPGDFQVKPELGETPEYRHIKDSLSLLMRNGKLSVKDWIVQDSTVDAKYQNQLISGWKITHAFRAKNGFGALTGQQWNFFVDTNFQVTSATPEE